MMRKRMYILLFLAVLLILGGCGTKGTGQVIIEKGGSKAGIQTFAPTGDAVCTDMQGRPIIRMFSTSWCPHCKWVKPTYAKVVGEYMDQGKITAHLWEVDKNDNLLTKEKDAVPSTEQAIFQKYNSEQSIPTFVFGCSYLRIGNGYENQGDEAAEEAEFRAVIDKLIAETQQ
jgi:thiol-disulfide isomerase/thioredoxin